MTTLAAGLLFFLAAAGSLLADTRQPVLVYLFSRNSDFVNIRLTESRIRDTVALVEKIRTRYPASHAAATVLLSGALSQTLSARNARTGIKDFLLNASRRGIIELGYDGTDEPTYAFRPQANVLATAPAEDRWRAHGDAARRFLTEARDPATGRVLQGKSGGLKAMQEVFGNAVCIRGLNTGLSLNSEYIQQIQPLNTSALLWGIPDKSPEPHLPGYRGSAQGFGNAMSPEPHSSPEVNWIDNYLRLSETSDAAIHVVSGQEGVEALKKVVDALDRARVHVVIVELNDVRMYLSEFFDNGDLFPPLNVAYKHPDHPALPEEAFASEKLRGEKQASQEALLQWLGRDFMPAHAGDRFVSSTDLMRMSPSGVGQDIKVSQLRPAIAAELKIWGSETYLPDYVLAGDRYLSLADTFQLLCDALSAEGKTAARPQGIRLRRIFGPIEVPDDHGPALGEVTAGAIARTAAELDSRLLDESFQPVPHNAVPPWVEVAGFHVTAGQFLRLMAEAFVASGADARIRIKMTYSVSSAGMEYPNQRHPSDQGGAWTFKPAPLSLSH